MQVNLEPELVKEKGKVKQNETMRGLKRRVAQRARAELPEPFAGWFAARGWRPHAQPASVARSCRREPRHAADRPHRRRQDACRLRAKPGRPHRARRQIAYRHPHPLRLTLEGPCRRYRPQSRGAGGGDGAAHHARDPYRRHPTLPPPAPASHPPRYSADHTAMLRAYSARSAWSSSTSCMR